VESSAGGGKTPLGTYNPDWAVLADSEDGERLYFVVETKGSPFLNDLRIAESARIACGRAHFVTGPLRGDDRSR
jgi:type III restriction enzyme